MFYNVDQNSDEWLDMRAGKVTGSAIAKVMANYGKVFGDPANRLAVDIALGRITRRAQAGGYTNAHMQRGHDQEPIARMLYEDEYFCDVSNGGFFDNGNTGCSPDGLVGNDGVIEIKSVVPSQHYKCIAKNDFDTAYKWQLYFNLKETGRDWIDYVSYCADFPDDNQLFVKRIYSRDISESIMQINTRLAEFELKVDEVTRVIRGVAA